MLKFNRLNEEYNKIAIEGYGDFKNEFLEEDTKEYIDLQTLKEQIKKLED